MGSFTLINTRKRAYKVSMLMLFQMLLTLQITSTFTKKKRLLEQSSSDESIENLLYYKDCKHKQKTTAAPVMLRQEAPKSACPCPRMCCSMCCECENMMMQPMIGRQMQPLQQGMQQGMPGSMQSVAQQPPMPMPPALRSGMGMNQIHMPVQPQIQRQKKKRMRPLGPPGMFPPINGRRDMGSLPSFTKDDIKSLISRDEDIKKILNNLVKVTMQKVDSKDTKKFKPTEAARVIDEDDDYVE